MVIKAVSSSQTNSKKRWAVTSFKLQIREAGAVLVLRDEYLSSVRRGHSVNGTHLDSFACTFLIVDRF